MGRKRVKRNNGATYKIKKKTSLDIVDTRDEVCFVYKLRRVGTSMYIIYEDFYCTYVKKYVKLDLSQVEYILDNMLELDNIVSANKLSHHIRVPKSMSDLNNANSSKTTVIMELGMFVGSRNKYNSTKGKSFTLSFYIGMQYYRSLVTLDKEELKDVIDIFQECINERSRVAEQALNSLDLFNS